MPCLLRRHAHGAHRPGSCCSQSSRAGCPDGGTWAGVHHPAPLTPRQAPLPALCVLRAGKQMTDSRAPATNTHRPEPIKREPVRPARTLRLPERPRGTPVEPGDAHLLLPPRPVHLAAGASFEGRSATAPRSWKGARAVPARSLGGTRGSLVDSLPGLRPPRGLLQPGPGKVGPDAAAPGHGSGRRPANRVRKCPARFW